MRNIEVGQLIQGRFRILKHLGQGAQADVFQAQDILSRKFVAIKQYLNIKSKYQKDLEQIEKEAELLQRIKHPNVMHCYQLLKFPEFWLVVLECIDGILLSDFIRSQFNLNFTIESMVDVKDVFRQLKPLENSPDLRYQYQSLMRHLLQNKISTAHMKDQKLLTGFVMDSSRPPSISQIESQYSYVKVESSKFEQEQENNTALEVEHVLKSSNIKMSSIKYYETIQNLFAQMLNVLVELDKQQIMHRDLKPDNIMITKDMVLKLIDFGFCKNTSVAKTVVGTQGFYAPEILTIIDAKQYTNKVDIWSTGVIFYFMLFGYQPFLNTKYFNFEKIQALKGLYLPPSLLGENYIDKKYIEAIEAALMVNPNERASAEKLQIILGLDKKDKTKTAKTPDIKIKVVLAGEYGLGKTTILKKMAMCNDQQQVQILHRQLNINGMEIMLDFYDTLGTEQNTGSMVPSILRNTNLCFLTYSLQNQDTFDMLAKWQMRVFESNDVSQSQSQKQKFYYLGNDFGGQRQVQIKDDELEKPMRHEAFQCNLNTDFDTILKYCLTDCIKDGCYQVDSENSKIQVEQKAKRGCC